jgi:simple sugar transport system ATP-binding protein
MIDKKEPLIKMKGICKNFGSVQALKNVDFEVHKGEVVGLLGDNGAGKTTLIKILLGLEQPSKGKIYLDGKETQISSTAQSRKWGMEAAYQGLALVPEMNIARNFFLGREITRLGPLKLLDMKKMVSICDDKLTDIGIRRKISSDNKVAFLSGGEKQSICIGRAVNFGAKILVLDEPTAALSINETNKVLEYVLEARNMGLSVIFITHNVYHVYEVADRFVILEEGSVIGNFMKKKVTPQQIIDVISKGKEIAEGLVDAQCKD